MRHKMNGWQLNSTLGEKAGFRDQLAEIIEIVYPSRDELSKVAQQYYAEVSCVVYLAIDADESVPSMHIEEDQLRMLAEMNLQIDFDVILTLK